jgi:acyl-coenzyme A thioesterase PaaI-like protein
MSEPSLQERYFPDLPCFGCGPVNERGLRLRSHLAPDFDVSRVVVASFTPWPEHNNGLGYLNGGIIGTILDCHTAAAVTHEAFDQGRTPLGGALLPYVTAGLDLHYRRPSPLHETVELRAWVTEANESEMTVHAELVWDDKVRAEASAHWKRWRPRS